MKHEKKHESSPLTNVLDTFYRKVVDNSGSKTLALTEILDTFHFVRVELLEKTEYSILVRITEVKK